jgi:methyl halide transferase
LIDILNDRKDLIGGPLLGNGKRKKALVPGCGKGYDVLLLSSYGYDAYGLEGSQAAVKTAELWQKDHEGEYTTKDGKVGMGGVKFVFGDFFKDGWTNDMGVETFDLIYDYTVRISTFPFQNLSPGLTSPSSYPRYHPLLAHPGPPGCPRFSLQRATSSASNSRRTKNHRQAAHHGLFRHPSTNSTWRSPASRSSTTITAMSSRGTGGS